MSRLPLDTGTIVSAGAHGVLLVWLVVGTVFRAEPLPMDVQPVSVISSEEFAALTAPVTPPATPDVAPEVSGPVVEVPTPEPTPPAAEPLDEDVAALPPEPPTPPAPIDRVAPEAVPEPEPDAQDDPDRQEAIVEDNAGDTEAEPQEATAPEAATTEIVTEADETTPAPTASLRPRPRPTQPVQPNPEVDPAPAVPSDPVADAIAQALENQATPPTPPTEPTAPSGPPLTGGELEGLRVSVSQCWNVGQLSTEAQDTRVTVYVAMNEDGTPQVDTIRMIDSQGGSSAAAERVFQTARRAIIRCGARGLPLPPEKFGQWREIEMTFDPEGMFWR